MARVVVFVVGGSCAASSVRALPHLPPRSVAPAASAAIVPTVRSSPPSRSAGSPWTGRTASRWFGTGASSTAATPPSLHTMKTGETSSPTSPIETDDAVPPSTTPPPPVLDEMSDCFSPPTSPQDTAAYLHALDPTVQYRDKHSLETCYEPLFFFRKHPAVEFHHPIDAPDSMFDSDINRMG
uniref:Uncharacterized protein n=1 Tax=Oryza meridionalis TaxID=40149 RepID=A0A0E0CFK3_9ORYZ